ncbi:MAG: HAD family hydrolase [Aestuariibaculum sp.]
MIKTLIFDFGNVFINLNIEKAVTTAQQAFNIDFFSEEITKKNESYETGQITTDGFLTFYSEKFPQLSKEALIEIWNVILHDFPKHRLEFIQKLKKENKYKLILLSNTNELHIDHIKKQVPFYNDFKNCFDAFYLSHEIHLRKPNSEIFKFVLKENTLNPTECLFIDDVKENCIAANKLGIKTWHINPKTEEVSSLFETKKALFLS